MENLPYVIFHNHFPFKTRIPAVCLLTSGLWVIVFDFSDLRKRYLNDVAVRAFHLDAWSGECLSGFHAPNNTPHALAVGRYNLDVVFAV